MYLDRSYGPLPSVGNTTPCWDFLINTSCQFLCIKWITLIFCHVKSRTHADTYHHREALPASLWFTLWTFNILIKTPEMSVVKCVFICWKTPVFRIINSSKQCVLMSMCDGMSEHWIGTLFELSGSENMDNVFLINFGASKCWNSLVSQTQFIKNLECNNRVTYIHTDAPEANVGMNRSSLCLWRSMLEIVVKVNSRAKMSLAYSVFGIRSSITSRWWHMTYQRAPNPNRSREAQCRTA